MPRIAILGAALALAVAAPALAGEAPAAGLRLAESIPPNCTMDPWTHKLNCPIPPNCTMDPWTHKLNCHVVRRAVRLG